MYIAFLTLFIVITVGGILTTIFGDEDIKGSGFAAFIMSSAFLFVFLLFVEYKEDKPIDIPMNQISIFSDQNSAVVKHKDKFLENYETIRDCNAIKDSLFVLKSTKGYNIFGKYLSTSYYLEFK